MNRLQAFRIVDAIVDDLTDRKGLKSEWYQIDEDTLDEILNTWVDIVMAHSEAPE